MSKAAIIIAIIIVIVIIACFGFAGYAIYKIGVFFPPNQVGSSTQTSLPNLESYLRLVGIVIVFITALITASVTLLNVVITLSTNREIEKLKPFFTLQYAAYKELNSAAIGIIDQLSRLQNNQYDSTSTNSADQEMTKASGTIFFMPDEYRKQWLLLQTIIRFAKETADKAVQEFGQNNSYLLEIKDEKGNIIYTKTINNQLELWSELQPKIFAGLEQLRKLTPN